MDNCWWSVIDQSRIYVSDGISIGKIQKSPSIHSYVEFVLNGIRASNQEFRCLWRVIALLATKLLMNHSNELFATVARFDRSFH